MQPLSEFERVLQRDSGVGGQMTSRYNSSYPYSDTARVLGSTIDAKPAVETASQSVD